MIAAYRCLTHGFSIQVVVFKFHLLCVVKCIILTLTQYYFDLKRILIYMRLFVLKLKGNAGH